MESTKFFYDNKTLVFPLINREHLQESSIEICSFWERVVQFSTWKVELQFDWSHSTVWWWKTSDWLNEAWKKTAAAAATELGSWFWIHQTKITSLPTIEEEQLLELKIRIVRAWNFHFFQDKRELYTAEWVSNLFAKCEYIHLYNYSGVYVLNTRRKTERKHENRYTIGVCVVLTWDRIAHTRKIAETRKKYTDNKKMVCLYMDEANVCRTHTDSRLWLLLRTLM